MSKQSIYSLGINTVLLTDETSYTLGACVTSEPIMLRNLSSGECTVSPISGETINGDSSIVLRHEACCYLHPSPNGTDWKYIHHNSPSFIGFPSGKGVGGSVTQSTSITTDVTLNKQTGKITLFSHDYSNNDIQTFVFNNSFIEPDDIIAVSMRSGSSKLNVQVDAVNNGSCTISVGDIHNQSTGSISVVLNFAVIKGAVD